MASEIILSTLFESSEFCSINWRTNVCGCEFFNIFHGYVINFFFVKSHTARNDISPERQLVEALDSRGKAKRCNHIDAGYLWA